MERKINGKPDRPPRPPPISARLLETRRGRRGEVEEGRGPGRHTRRRAGGREGAARLWVGALGSAVSPQEETWRTPPTAALFHLAWPVHFLLQDHVSFFAKKWYYYYFLA